GIALADLDGDGDMDVIATRLDATPMLYRNETSAPRIAVRLSGKTPNDQGIGAKVSVIARSLPKQTREMTAGGYYLSGSDAELTFATGRDTSVTIEAQWRSGRVTTVKNAQANRLYVIRESAAVAPSPPRTEGERARDSTLA